jgi:ferredoxin-NADP reductase
LANPQKIKAEIKEITSYGRQVYKLLFKTERKMPRFKAGQFLHLTLEEFDPTTGFWPESRVFSIASCSDDRKEISIVYSVKGVYTKKMEDSLFVGATVWLKAPYGEFIIPNFIKEDQTAVLIAGGTGVSPFIPFLKQSDNSTRIQLNYGLRNKDLIIFDEDLNQILANENFSLNLYLEEMGENLPFTGDIHQRQGFLSIEQILKDVEDKNKSVFFISGPPAMINLFRQQLMHFGIEKENIIIDQWS